VLPDQLKGAEVVLAVALGLRVALDLDQLDKDPFRVNREVERPLREERADCVDDMLALHEPRGLAWRRGISRHIRRLRLVKVGGSDVVETELALPVREAAK
jgi:hypothetical protein